MAIVFDAVSGAGSDFAASITISHTVSGNDRVLVVIAWVLDGDGTTTIDSATYAGTAMAAGTEHSTGAGAANVKTRRFSLVAPATGANDIVVTYNNANGKPQAVGLSYTGVDQTAPVSGEVYATNPVSSAMEWTVTSAAGDLVIAGGLVGDSGVFTTPGTGTTERRDANGVGTTLWGGDEAGAASVVIGGTLDLADDWYGIGLSLKAAADGAMPPWRGVQRAAMSWV